MTTALSSFRSRWVTRSLLVVCLLLVYNANLRQVSSLDTYASRQVPIALLRHGELTLDRFFPDLAGDHPDAYLSTYLYRTGGHLYDSHPPVGSLMALPVYAIPVWLGVPRDADAAGSLLSKLSASLFMAMAALALFVALSTVGRQVAPHGTGRFTPETAAMIAVVIFGLGTSVWSAASQALWTHTPAVLGYALAVWGIVSGFGAVAGAAAGLAAVARPATAPVALLLIGFLIHRAMRHRAAGGAAVAETGQAIKGVVCLGLVAGSGVLFNLMICGSVAGGAAGRTTNWVEAFGVSSMFEGSLLTGLAGLTISPSRGILVFSPVVLLAVVGGFRVWRTRLGGLASIQVQDAVLLGRYATLGAVAMLLTYSQYLVWWGGHGFGPRYLTDVMPLAALLFLFGLVDLDRPARLKSAAGPSPRMTLRATALIVLGTYSIGIQAVGAFCWPSPWTRDGSSAYVAKLWDWEDNQIASCVRSGPRVDPMARRLFERLGL